MFRKLFVKPPSAPAQEAAQTSASSSGLSSDHISPDDIPCLKRRHSLVTPYSESLFLNSNLKQFDSSEISIDPFEHSTLRRSKSIAEGMLERCKEGEDFFNLRLSKSVRFLLPVNDSSVGLDLPLFDTSCDTSVSKDIPKSSDTNVATRTEQLFEKLNAFNPSPTRSITSSSYGDTSEADDKVEFLSLTEYKSFETLEQKKVTSWTREEECVQAEENSSGSPYDDQTTSSSDATVSPKISPTEQTLQLTVGFENLDTSASTHDPGSVAASNEVAYFLQADNAATAAADLAANKDLRISKLEADIISLTEERGAVLEAMGNKILKITSDIHHVENGLVGIVKREEVTSLGLKFAEQQINQIAKEFASNQNSQSKNLIELKEKIDEKNYILSCKEVKFIKMERKLKGKISELERQLKHVKDDERAKIEVLNALNTTLTRELAEKDEEILGSKSKLEALQSNNKKLLEDLSACSQDVQELDTQLKKEISNNTNMQRSMKEHEEMIAKNHILVTQLKLENQSLASSYEYELKLQTIEIKKLIEENRELIDKLKDTYKEKMELSSTTKKCHSINEKIIYSNKVFRYYLIMIIQIISIKLSVFMEESSNGLIRDAIQNITLYEVPCDHSDHGGKGEIIENSILESVVHFISRAVENLIAIFRQNEKLLEIELANKSINYQQMLIKLIDMMEERGIVTSPMKRKVKKKFN